MNFIPLIILFSIYVIASDPISHNVDQNNTQPQKIAKVNNYLIKTSIFGKKQNKFYQLKIPLKKNLIQKLIDDELLSQYVLKNDPLLDEKDPQKRIQNALTKIKKIALQEINSTITDQEIKKFYQDNKDNMGIESYSIASHILVKDKNKTSLIISQLKTSQDINSTFSNLAKKYSIDARSNKKGGYLGFFPDKAMPFKFRQALNSLHPNEFTKIPIQTSFGYHIILLHKKMNKEFFSYEKLIPTIRKRILNSKLQKWYKQKLQEAKKSATVQNFKTVQTFASPNK
jgi:parvulin-like peptidyl-prolyl isomerase